LVEAAIPLLIGSLPIKRSQTTLKLLARSGTSTEGPTILGPPNAESEAWLLSLDGRWFPCKVTTSGRGLWIENAAEPIRAGMSGSPIVALEGSAIGVVCVSSVTDRNRSGGPNAELWQHLPGWLLRSAQKNPESDPVTQLGAGVDDRQEQ
jgi:hypothetical protein